LCRVTDALLDRQHAFHPQRPCFGLGAVGVSDRPLGGFTGALRAYLGAHDPAAPNDLALLGAHGQRLQRGLRAIAMPLPLALGVPVTHHGVVNAGTFGLKVGNELGEGASAALAGPFHNLDCRCGSCVGYHLEQRCAGARFGGTVG
jgi:hypothetical protein